MTSAPGPQFGPPDPNARWLDPRRTTTGRAGVEYDLWIPSPPPRPKRSKKLWWTIGIAALALFLVLGTIGGVLVKRRYDAAQAGRPTPSPQPTTTSSPTPKRTPGKGTATPVPEPTPIVAGWQVVKGSQEAAAYDVPPDWRVRKTLTGYQTPEGVSPAAMVVMHDPATYRFGACPEVSDPTNRGTVGFVTTPRGTPEQAAPALATQWADVAGIDAGGDHSPVSGPVTSTITLRGGVKATKSVTTMRPIDQGVCIAPQMSFTAVAFADGNGETTVLMLVLDRDTPDSLPQQVADQVAASVRPLG